MGTARIRGCLYRVTWYPGVKFGGGPDDWVTGDLYRIEDAGILTQLDDYEGSNEFQRVKAVARTPQGEELECWVYEYLGDVQDSAKIASGNWVHAASEP